VSDTETSRINIKFVMKLKKTPTELFHISHVMYGKDRSYLKHSYKITSGDASECFERMKTCMERCTVSHGNNFVKGIKSR
jgi:hypothetical protein